MRRDRKNRQISYTSGDTNASYTYYPNGMRCSKYVNGKTATYYWNSDGSMVFETCGNNEKDYYFGGSLFVTDGLFCFTNAHGDVIALFDDDGTIMKRYEYDAFGNEINPDESDTNPYRYCAEYYDIESGTIYLRARYYSPTHGRFTQLDPARDGLNWYAYCANNPIMFVDPSGRKPEKLRHMIAGLDAKLEWDDKTKTATVTIQGTTHKYTVGENAYIEDNTMYVEGADFAKDFGGTYTDYSEEGYEGYVMTTNVEAVKDNPRGAKPISAGYFVFVKKISITFDESTKGDLEALRFENGIMDDYSEASGAFSLLCGFTLGEIGVKIPSYISYLCSAAGIVTDYSIDLRGGDTYQSFYKGSYNYRGGGGGNGGAIVIRGNRHG